MTTIIVVKIETNSGKQESSIYSYVCKYDISDEIADSAYIKRRIKYFVDIGKDTPDFHCIFTGSKDEKININININIHISSIKKRSTHAERIKNDFR